MGNDKSWGAMTETELDDFTETPLTSRTVYEGVLLRVLADKVRLPDGRTADREYIRHPGAAMILAFIDSETLILQRQFRYPLQRHFIELPAGKIEKGEDALATARRELREECGYEAGTWRRLATLHPCIGYADERIELYLARDLVHVGSRLDPGEFLQCLPIKIADALQWVRDGRITEAKAITGLMWADRISRGEWS
jgi:ADP-ribose pyrophosphatase